MRFTSTTSGHTPSQMWPTVRTASHAPPKYDHAAGWRACPPLRQRLLGNDMDTRCPSHRPEDPRSDKLEGPTRTCSPCRLI